jgi:hypothetical protein
MGGMVSRFAVWLLVIAMAVLSGCEESDAPPESSATAAVEMGRDFDAANAGEIRGRVTWHGALPEAPSYRAPVSPGNEHAGGPRCLWPNPNVPRIDPRTHGVAGAVIFLRGVDPRRSRPWDHPPVRVELRDYRIRIGQGEHEDHFGFVRRGEAVTLVSRQQLYHSLRARGVAFFARAFPDADRPCTQQFERAGLVELSSGCGYFWMRGWLFVDEHPYYTHTDAEGRFTLPQVPPGRYELVCWLPNWHEASREWDAETALICRLTFRPPVQIGQSVQIAPRQTQTATFQLDEERFGR